MLHAQNGATDAKLRHDEHGHLKHGKLEDLVEIGPPDLGFLARISMQHGSRRRDSPESGRRRGGGRGRPPPPRTVRRGPAPLACTPHLSPCCPPAPSLVGEKEKRREKHVDGPRRKSEERGSGRLTAGPRHAKRSLSSPSCPPGSWVWGGLAGRIFAQIRR